MRALWLLSVALLACGGDSLTVEDAGLIEDTDADTDTDSDTDTDTDADADADADMPTVDPAEVTSVGATLNALHGTVIHVAWDQSEAASVSVEFTFENGTWISSPVRELEAGSHEELILGVPYATEVTWRVVADNTGGNTTTPDQIISTSAAPDGLPEAFLLTSDPGGQDADMDHILVSVGESGSLASRTWTMVIDRMARVVWAHKSPSSRTTMHPRISAAEDTFLIDHNSFWAAFDGGNNSDIVEVQIDGTELRSVAVPGHHHPFTQLPDGSIAYTQAQGVQFGTYDDAVVILDPSGGTTELFRCDVYLNSIGENGWCGTNTLSYDEVQHTYLFSIFTHDAILQIDADTGEVIRRFGDINGTWSFSPPDSQFWYQHGPIFTDTGTLLVSTHASRNNDELVAREYEIDDLTQTLTQVWSFGEGENVDGTQMGEAHRLSGGNTLQNYGTHAAVREFTTGGDVVWDIRWEQQEYGGAAQHFVGRSAPMTQDLWDFAPEQP